jgi:hypothetical protein
MKKLYSISVLFLLVLSVKVNAQNDHQLSYKQESDLLIEHLDKDQIKTGIFYDRVFPLAHLQTFTGHNIAN